MLGTLADFAAAGRLEPVVLYRSLMTDPASTGSAYSTICSTWPSADLGSRRWDAHLCGDSLPAVSGGVVSLQMRGSGWMTRLVPGRFGAGVEFGGAREVCPGFLLASQQPVGLAAVADGLGVVGVEFDGAIQVG